MSRSHWLNRLGILAFAIVSPLHAAEPAWVHVNNPTAAEVAGKFKNPPAEYANSVTWGWNGPMTEDVIVRDLDALHERGLRVATIEAGYRMDSAPYLSEEWFKLIRFACVEAQKRGMKLIIIDEGKYPSGFVNGKYTRERPDLRMQALVGPPAVQVAGGQVFERDVETNVLSAIAFSGNRSMSVPIENRKIRWTAPDGANWTIQIAAHDFRTPQTRAVVDANQAKTTANSMGDLINPEATRLFIEWTHEQYKKHVGDMFGKVILGFRGDEPEMTGVPWTPSIAEEFKKRKGYDVTPYLASFLAGGGGGGRGGGSAIVISEEQRRAKADYFDVWGELFGANFFDTQADWCAANGVVATTHLNNDHNLPGLVGTTADFFRPMKKYQVPGVDVIWSQVYPGKVAEFVRFPSSASHVNGRSRALSESFAAYNADEPATYEVVNFAVNYQLARGINLFEFMFFTSSFAGPRTSVRGYMGDARFPELAAYTNRLTYILAQGKPMAQVALYCPTMSIWLNDRVSNDSLMYVAQHLSDNQRDFDVVDDASFADGMKLEGGAFINRSSQAYRAVVIPASTAMSEKALERLQAFARAGGKVVFVGYQPTLAVGKNFKDAQPPKDLSWAVHEPLGEVSAKVLAALPKSDVTFDKANPAVKVMHRQWKDSDAYFFFNESDQPQTIAATVEGKGQVQTWDAFKAQISPLVGVAAANGSIQLPMQFSAHEAKLIVIGNPVSMAAR